MSRGLGEAQRLILRALLSLENEHPGEGSRFFAWAIVDRAYALSPALQAEQEGRRLASVRAQEHLMAEAKAGNAQARELLMLDRRLRGPMRSHPRTRRTSPWSLTETRFNPSRVLASLERRGLVHRTPIKGGGAAGLTDAGRALALSVGSSLPLGPEAAA